MRTRHLSLLPYMLALLVGAMSMPALNVYDIHARGIGIVDAGHRGSAASLSDLAPAEQPTVLTRFLERMRFMATAEDGYIHSDLLVPVSATDIKALKQRAADILANIDKTDGELTAKDATDEQRAKARADLKQLTDMATENSAALDQAQQIAAMRAKVTPIQDPDQEAATRAAKGAGITVVRDNTEDDPKRGFKSHREFLGKVMDFYRGGMSASKLDARLKPLFAAAGSDEQGNYSDPHGGFLQPVAFSPDILAVQADGDPTAGLTRDLPMTAPMVQVNARVDKDHSNSVSGGLRVYRHAEATAATSSRAELEKLTFQAHELIGLAHATESQISDSPLSFIALIADGFREEFGAKTLSEKIRGTGAGGQYLGILNSPALITVAKQSQQPNDTIQVENIDKMAARCWRYASERTVYLANPTTRPQLRGLVRAAGTGGAPVAYFTQDAQGRERLDGRLIFFTEFASALGDVGDIVLVNLSEYIEGLYQGAQQAESIHVRFETHERSFKWWLRNAGMPWWRSALTPKYGDTMSPLVTLAAR